MRILVGKAGESRWRKAIGV